MGTFVRCPQCDQFLVPISHICVNPKCSTNRPTDRPRTSKPSAEDAQTASQAPTNPCKLCHKSMPENARYCPYCRAPARPSATAAYHILDNTRFIPPPLPRIEEDDADDDDAPPTPRDSGQSGFRKKFTAPDVHELEASCGGKKGR